MNSDINMHLSDRVLHNANIGMWEIDEGAAPRMYGSETMLGLLGVTEQLTPEQLYHAWYDNIHPDHYDAVAAVVDRMISGEQAEVQYPWYLHGEMIYVRCGGIRDYSYTQGVRLEGCHQDVTETVHIQKQMDNNISYMKDFEPLDEKEQAAVEEVKSILYNKYMIPCTGCKYCVDGCPMNIQIPRLFNQMNKLTAFNDKGAFDAYNHITAESGKASDCVGCGACEESCPQKLEIRELLVKVAETFEK